MLTQTEVEKFRKLVQKETGKKLSYEESERWAKGFYKLMLLLVLPTEQRYSVMLLESPPTDRLEQTRLDKPPDRV